MRADRLISLIMLLQTRGRMTAQALAEVLEVSERTIHRDIEALSTAGVPVYTESGPGGGCQLLDDYRSDLTGLTEEEVRALLMLGIPGPLKEVGASQALRSAIVKLLASLPAVHRKEETQVRQRIHLDWAGWEKGEESPPHLQTIREAVWHDRVLQVTCSAMFGARIEQTVEPYGLVAKANSWYLVCARRGELRVLRVSRVLEAQVTEMSFRRPADFDLAGYWEEWCRREGNRPYYPVTVRVAPALIPDLPYYLGRRPGGASAIQAGIPDAQGWVTLTLSFEGLGDARARLLNLGRAVEVLEPEALRLSLADCAEQVVALYRR